MHAVCSTAVLYSNSGVWRVLNSMHIRICIGDKQGWLRDCFWYYSNSIVVVSATIVGDGVVGAGFAHSSGFAAVAGDGDGGACIFGLVVCRFGSGGGRTSHVFDVIIVINNTPAWDSIESLKR